MLAGAPCCSNENSKCTGLCVRKACWGHRASGCYLPASVCDSVGRFAHSTVQPSGCPAGHRRASPEATLGSPPGHPACSGLPKGARGALHRLDPPAPSSHFPRGKLRTAGLRVQCRLRSRAPQTLSSALPGPLSQLVSAGILPRASAQAQFAGRRGGAGTCSWAEAGRPPGSFGPDAFPVTLWSRA